MQKESNCGTLYLCCHMSERLWYPCYVTIYRLPEDETVLIQRLPANQNACICLPEGHYRVRVRNTAGLDPGGFSRWLYLHEEEEACMNFYFFAGSPSPPMVTLDITVTDAHYPGILPINGGITLWQQPTTRFPL
ncbi:MAG: hypothetical protein MJ077_06615 [Oscillospiraceae bacterium]|nr:hypothetical protein [Oscillospiraceae bacterium]